MYKDGFQNILNIDYSDVVIKNMRERHKHLIGMTWMVADAQDLTRLDPKSFDVVLEKGTLDAMLVDERDPWNISVEGEATIDNILNQVNQFRTYQL